MNQGSRDDLYLKKKGQLPNMDPQEVKQMCGGFLQKAEDITDVVIAKLRPHARGLAKFGILFFHVQLAILVILQFNNVSRFIGFYLGTNNEIEVTEEDDPDKSRVMPTSPGIVSQFLALLLVASRFGSLILIFLKKHITIACVVLSVPNFITIGMHFNERFGFHTIFSIFTFLSLNGCLLMVAADTMEEKDLKSLGLPSWGINKKMSILQLLSRVNIILVVLGLQTQFAIAMARNTAHAASMIVQLVIIFPILICVVVGYKTKFMSVLLAALLTLFTMISFPFFLHLAQGNTFRFWVESAMFGVNFSGVGSLIYIAILGAGTYSVDHLKAQ